MLIVVLLKLAGLIGDQACGIPSPFGPGAVPATVEP
jgi:hypothetical protein